MSLHEKSSSKESLEKVGQNEPEVRICESFYATLHSTLEPLLALLIIFLVPLGLFGVDILIIPVL